MGHFNKRRGFLERVAQEVYEVRHFINRSGKRKVLIKI
jgi:hypothetical protein